MSNPIPPDLPGLAGEYVRPVPRFAAHEKPRSRDAARPLRRPRDRHPVALNPFASVRGVKHRIAQGARSPGRWTGLVRPTPRVRVSVFPSIQESPRTCLIPITYLAGLNLGRDFASDRQKAPRSTQGELATKLCPASKSPGQTEPCWFNPKSIRCIVPNFGSTRHGGNAMWMGPSLPSWFWLAAHLGGGNGVAQLPVLSHLAVRAKGRLSSASLPNP